VDEKNGVPPKRGLVVKAFLFIRLKQERAGGREKELVKT
jgi:hypothetical protein